MISRGIRGGDFRAKNNYHSGVIAPKLLKTGCIDPTQSYSLHRFPIFHYNPQTCCFQRSYITVQCTSLVTCHITSHHTSRARACVYVCVYIYISNPFVLRGRSPQSPNMLFSKILHYSAVHITFCFSFSYELLRLWAIASYKFCFLITIDPKDRIKEE